MATISITLPDEQARKLEDLAKDAGLSPEELVRAGVVLWLSLPGSDFAEAAAHVLKKNAELYRRLA